MAQITENTIEIFAIELLKKLGYEYLFGPDLAPDGVAPERDSYSQVLLLERLRNYFCKISFIFSTGIGGFDLWMIEWQLEHTGIKSSMGLISCVPLILETKV